MKTPRRLTLEHIWSAYNADRENRNKAFYNKDGLAVLLGDNLERLLRLLLQPAAPFLVEEYRLGLVRSGAARMVINLMERELTAGMLVFITPGTIIELVNFTSDFQLMGMGLSGDLFRLAHGKGSPQLFNGQVKDGRILAEEEDLATIQELLSLLWRMVHASRMDQAVLLGIISSITSYYNWVFSRGEPLFRAGSTSAHTLFDRFIQLVNEHCRTHRSLDFYAGELCVTERYLGTVIHQVSGIKAKDWIDRAVLSLVKVMLRHSNRSVNQIADELNFPNASFFCKYFKRLTGNTPREYRME